VKEMVARAGIKPDTETTKRTRASAENLHFYGIRDVSGADSRLSALMDMLWIKNA